MRCPTTPAINDLIGSVFLVEPLADDTEPSVGTEAQALSFGNLPSSALVGDVANLELGASSGLAVSVDLEPDSTGCSLSGNTINADQAPSAGYSAADRVRQSITVAGAAAVSLTPAKLARVTITSHRLVPLQQRLHIVISCANATCRGLFRLELTVMVRAMDVVHGRLKATMTRRTIFLGRGRVGLVKGRTTHLVVRLNATARRALQRLHQLRCVGVVTVSGRTTRHTLVIT